MFIKKLKNQTGLGLVEVMVAASILGGLSLVVMKLNESGTQGVSRVEKGMEIVEFDAEINNYLSTPEGCTGSLGAAPLPLLTAFDTNTEKIYLPNIKDKDGVTVRFSPNDKRGNVTFKEAYLTAYRVAAGSPTFGPGPGNAFLFKIFEFPLSPGKTMTKTKISTVAITPDPLNTRIGSCVIRATKSDSVWSVDTYGISYSTPGTVAIGKSANNSVPHALDIQGQVVMGLGNTVSGSNVGGASIFGGYRNIISGSTGSYSSINGGDNNSISDARSATINGGSYNVINTSGNYGAIVGGYTNTVSAQAGVVVGGEFNYVSGSNAASVGGRYNLVQGQLNSTFGGSNNFLSSAFDSANNSILAGFSNTIYGNYNVILGGLRNIMARSANSAIVNGQSNAIGPFTQNSSITAGYANLIMGGALNTSTSIIGGASNIIGSPTSTTNSSSILGGESNLVQGRLASIIGGQRNTVSSSTSTILGGDQNQISASSISSSIVGGQQNLQQGTGNSIILGGANNLNLANHSAIVGGTGNQLLGTTSHSSGIFASGGSIINPQATYSVILGGSYNTLGTSSYNSSIISSLRSSNSAQWSTVLGGYGNIIGTNAGNAASSIIGGNRNQIIATAGGANEIFGGNQNIITGTGSNIIVGGFLNVGNGTMNAILSSNRSTTTSSSANAIILGGGNNTVTGPFATVISSQGSRANAGSTVIGGRNLQADMPGVFMIGDQASTTPLAASTWNEFTARFTGGFRMCVTADCSSRMEFTGSPGWSYVSDRSLKRDIQPVDGMKILESIDQLKVTSWVMKNIKNSKRSIGPMSQDFYELFGKPLGLSSSERTINQNDMSGVTLVGLKALSEKTADENQYLKDENKRLKERVRTLEERMMNIEARLEMAK